MTDPADCEHETLTEETLEPATELGGGLFRWTECEDCGAVVRDTLWGDDDDV